MSRYVDEIKRKYLDISDFLLEKLKSEENVCLRVILNDEKNPSYDKEVFLKCIKNGDSEKVDFELIIDKSNSHINKNDALEYISKGSFEDLFIEKDEEFYPYFNLDKYKNKELLKDLDDSKKDTILNSIFFEDFINFGEIELEDLSYKNTFDKSYRFSFLDEETGEVEYYIAFPSLNFSMDYTILSKDKVIGNMGKLEKLQNITLDKGCLFFKLTSDGILDFSNVDSISLDELSFIIIAQNQNENDYVLEKDNLQMQLLKRFLVINNSLIQDKDVSSTEKKEYIKENFLLKDVCFYIENGKYIIEVQRFNEETQEYDSFTKEYDSFKEFVLDKKLSNILSQKDFKRNTIDASLELNYQVALQLLRKKIIENEEKVLNSFIFRESDSLSDLQEIFIEKYYCTNYVHAENYQDFLEDDNFKLPEDCYIKEYIKENQFIFDNNKQEGYFPYLFLRDVIENNKLLMTYNDGKIHEDNEIYQNIFTIYKIYGLDSSNVISKIKNIYDSNHINNEQKDIQIKEIFFRDFDTQYWEKRINHLSLNKYGDKVFIPGIDIEGKTKTDLFIYLAELSFYKCLQCKDEKNFLDKDSKKIDIDKMFENNLLIYQDLCGSDFQNYKGYDRFLKVGETQYLDYINFEHFDNTFKHKCKVLGVCFEDLANEEGILRENFDKKKNDYKFDILVEYIKSSIRYPNDSIELKNIIKTYESEYKKYGKDIASDNLEMVLLKLKEPSYEKIFEENESTLNTFFEYNFLDFESIMREKISSLENEESINFNLWKDTAECTITKERDKYYICIDFPNGHRTENYYELNKIIEILNYRDETGKDFIPKEDKDNLISLYKNDVLKNITFKVLESSYADIEVNSLDSLNTKIQKKLAKGDTIVLRKSTEKAGDEEFILLQKTNDGKIIKKTMEILHTNKTAKDYRSDDITSINCSFVDKTIDSKNVRYYYFEKENKDPSYSISTEILSSAELTNYIDSLYLRDWDLEDDKEIISNLTSKNAFSRTIDKKVFELAKTSSMSIEEKRLFLLNEKIASHLSNENSFKNYPSDTYVLIDEYNTLDENNKSNKVTKKQVINISRSSDKEGKDNSNVFDINIIEYVTIKKDGKETTFSNVKTIEEALYKDDKTIKISYENKKIVEKLLDDMYSDKQGRVICSNYFKENLGSIDCKKNTSENTIHFANILKIYKSNMKAIDFIQNCEYYRESIDKLSEISFEENKLIEILNKKEVIDFIEKIKDEKYFDFNNIFENGDVVSIFKTLCVITNEAIKTNDFLKEETDVKDTLEEISDFGNLKENFSNTINMIESSMVIDNENTNTLLLFKEDE